MRFIVVFILQLYSTVSCVNKRFTAHISTKQSSHEIQQGDKIEMHEFDSFAAAIGP